MKHPSPDIAAGLPAFVDLETAARMAGVTRRTVQNKLATGEIPAKAVKMNGRQKLVAVAALAAVFGTLNPPVTASSQDELHGSVHGRFHEAPNELVELRTQTVAKDAIIANLQATLDHERKDREHERENWRKTLERTQGILLATQDTPTARALAGAPKADSVEVAAEQSAPPRSKPRYKRKTTKSPWWPSLFTI